MRLRTGRGRLLAGFGLGFGLASILTLTAPSAHAVILGGVDGTANTTAPADDPGWDRVGLVNGSSAVYLGNDFVLSAKHVDAGNLLLNGTSYTLDPTYTPQYLETAPGQFADLVIFRVINGPTMNFMPIYSGSGEAGSTATLIGIGADRGTEVPNQGWLWDTNHTMRWGQNIVDGSATVNQGSFFYQALVTDFDRVGLGGSGLANEATGAFGDSGGGLFIKQGGVWKLAGIMAGVTQDGRSFYDNNTSLPGDQPDQMGSVRLSAYSNWILSTIPEPSTVASGAIGLAGLVVAILRRRRCAS